MAQTRSRARSRTLTDHDEIRKWAEERNAHPASVRKTGGNGDVGMIRLDFPGYSGEESLKEIPWDDWFRKFNQTNLALIVQDETASGQKSNFNKLVGRETAKGSVPRRRTTRAKARSAAAGRSRGRARSARATSSGRSARSASSRASGTSSGRRRSSKKTSSRRASSRARTTRTTTGRGQSRTRSARGTSSRRSTRSRTQASSAKRSAGRVTGSSRSSSRRKAA